MKHILFSKPLRRSSAFHQFLPLVVLTAVLVGCSSPERQTSKSDTQSAATPNDVSAAVTGAEVPTPSAEWSPDQSAPLKISDFIAALNKNNLKVTSKDPMLFEMIKASDGCRITIGRNYFEVYQVDASTKQGLKTLAVWREQGIFGYPTKVRKNLALGNFEKHPKSKEIVAIFEGL